VEKLPFGTLIPGFTYGDYEAGARRDKIDISILSIFDICSF